MDGHRRFQGSWSLTGTTGRKLCGPAYTPQGLADSSTFLSWPTACAGVWVELLWNTMAGGDFCTFTPKTLSSEVLLCFSMGRLSEESSSGGTPYSAQRQNKKEWQHTDPPFCACLPTCQIQPRCHIQCPSLVNTPLPVSQLYLQASLPASPMQGSSYHIQSRHPDRSNPIL